MTIADQRGRAGGLLRAASEGPDRAVLANSDVSWYSSGAVGQDYVHWGRRDMNQVRRLWAEVTGHLLEEVIGIHRRAHAAFGQKLGRTPAISLFQGKRRNRTIIYNAEYGPAGKLQRGVVFIASPAVVQSSSSEQWSIGHGWRYWTPTAKHLERLAARVYDAIADELNVDLAPLKMPIKLCNWTNDLALEYAQRSRLDPDHPLLAKCLRGIFVRGGHETVVGEHYELPHEGLGGHVAAYVLAACRCRVDQRWGQVYEASNIPVDIWPKAPQLWTELTPEAEQGVALGYPRPAHRASDSPGGIKLARYPHANTHSADAALHSVTGISTASKYDVVTSFPGPDKPDRLGSWAEVLHRIVLSGVDGTGIWNLAQPDVLESVRQAIKAWDRSFSRWAKGMAESA